MPTRTLTVDGKSWRVYPSGFVTQMTQDEYGLIFVHGTGDARVTRLTRYSPVGARSREESLAELSDDDLRRLFAMSQTGTYAPETGYSR